VCAIQPHSGPICLTLACGNRELQIGPEAPARATPAGDDRALALTLMQQAHTLPVCARQAGATQQWLLPSTLAARPLHAAGASSPWSWRAPQPSLVGASGAPSPRASPLPLTEADAAASAARACAWPGRERRALRPLFQGRSSLSSTAEPLGRWCSGASPSIDSASSARPAPRLRCSKPYKGFIAPACSCRPAAQPGLGMRRLPVRQQRLRLASQP
jgi:hypothetical protein